MIPILFCLEHCAKCESTKQLLKDSNINLSVITVPNNFKSWSAEQKRIVEEHNVLNDLLVTAPILVTTGAKIIGQLRVKEWVKNGGKYGERNIQSKMQENKREV